MEKETFYERFSEYESVRGGLRCKLIDPNRLPQDETVIVKPWLDLAVCCYYDMETDGLPGVSFVIRKSFLSRWQVSAERVMADAAKNMRESGELLFRWLEGYMNELTGEAEREEVYDGPVHEELTLYILTNRTRMFGAVYMTLPDVLRRIGEELGRNYFLLPSSIHECLILPDTGEVEVSELNALIRMVNRTHVAEAEVLSDHAYRYDRESGEVRIPGGAGNVEVVE